MPNHGNLLEHGPSNIGLKASLKEYNMENLAATWAGPADRGKIITLQGSADSRSALFTYNKRSGQRCRSKELPLACEKIVIK